MAWVRIDQKFHWHANIEPLSDAAYRLFVGALCWCNFQETDGEITAAQLHNVSQRMTKRRREVAIDQLLAVGLWTETPRGYEIKNYLKFQPSRTDLEDRRTRMAELGSEGGKRRAEAARSSDALEATRFSASFKPVRPSVPSVRPLVTNTPLGDKTHPAPVVLLEDPVLDLQIWWHEFIGRQISEHDKQAAAAFVVEYPRLGVNGIQARIIEHATWRTEHNKPALGKLELYRTTLGQQESHLADIGVQRPRESQSAGMERLGEVLAR